MNLGTLTPSNRRQCRRHPHLFALCRHLLRPRLLRPALGEAGHRQVTTNQIGLDREILDVLCSYAMVRLMVLATVSICSDRFTNFPKHSRAARPRQIQEYDSSMNKLQLSIFKTRLTLIAAALALVGLAAGLRSFIR